MEEEYSVSDPLELLQAASDFSFDPGSRSDASVKAFLSRFPLPAIISALQTQADVPGLENALVDCLEKIFKTKYGTSLIPHYMAFLVIGLQADSHRVRSLACKAISCLFDNLEEPIDRIASLINAHGLYPLLLNCLINGDEQVAVAAMEAIKNLAGSKLGMEIIFPATTNEATDLKHLASRSSSVGRVRVLALIVKLFSTSTTVASLVYNSNLLSMLEAEVRDVDDTLTALSVLELLYELAEVQHSREYLFRANLPEFLVSIISNSSAESILRSRAMMISGRLLSEENILMFTNESSIKSVISAIDGQIGSMESQDIDECECALEALGQIGSSNQGASLLLSSSSAARHVVSAAFDQHGRGKQLAALHSLANIVGETRAENNMMLNAEGEESLRKLIYETASETPKLIPSGLFLSVLKLESEFRIAGYRLIKGLVVRPWFLLEICSREELINIVTDPYTETTKIGMDAKYACCQAIAKAFASSSTLMGDPSLSGIAKKLQEAVVKGPYLARRYAEAQPEVMTADRF